MGKGRDRGNRRDRFHHDDEEPSYEYAPQSFGAGPALDATVKWFNATKGFGFVELSDGSGDAFLHVAKLQSLGHDSVEPGTKLSVQVGQGQKGRQVEAVLSLDASTAAAPRQFSRPAAPRERSAGRDRGSVDMTGAVDLEGTIKWYNADKGFGFAGCNDGDRDVFIHASVLERAGLRGLNEGQRVSMKVAKTAKGREAVSITIVE
jgi:CspA family cold shock protein